MNLVKKLEDPEFIKLLRSHNQVTGHESPGGRITYNNIVHKRSFAMFTDIITSIVPLEVVNDPAINHKLPSIAVVLGRKYKHVYPSYLYLNATMEEYMDYEDEEDAENMSSLMDAVAELPLKTGMVGITVQKSEAMGSAHASAFIAWRSSPRKFKLAYYDPLAYKKAKKSYDFADRAFVGKRFDKNIEFINLAQYCFHKTPEEFHCSQYVINAEYCYIYSLYFLHKWIEYGARLHRASFRHAIKSTYIVKPELLTRAKNKESMIYRVVMMAFLCESLLAYLKGLPAMVKRRWITNSSVSITRIETYLKEFEQLYGFSLKL